MKTDKKLRNDVIAELRWEPSINAEQIGVAVKDGVVTLTGHVESYIEKWAAEKAVQKVAGVRALAVEMDVNLPGLSQRSDADIAGSARSVLEWTSCLPEEPIQIMVEHGRITLTGDVAWQYQRQAAFEAVANLMGVKGISNHISIKSNVSVNGIKADIQEALRRRAVEGSHKIMVDVQGADVILSGTADNWLERELAKHTALSTAGVSSVKNNIRVDF